jgi:hypothetical protein
MITTVGKVLSFVLIVLSLVAVGLALWVYLDHRDWKKEVEDLTKEIQDRRTNQEREEQLLRAVLAEVQAGNRQMPWSIDVGDGGGLAAPQMLAVNKAKAELVQAEEANKGLQDQVNQLQVQQITVIGRLKDQRGATERALAEQRRLREDIEAHNFDGQVRPFRDVIAESRKAKEAAEAQQEAIRPGLINALAELAVALKRNEQLNRRLEEIK